MLLCNIEFILCICIVLFACNHAADHKVSAPVIMERNCTHVTYSSDVEYSEFPTNMEIVILLYTSEKTSEIVARTSFSLFGGFFFEKGSETKERKHFNYTSVRADPIPATWEDKHTLYVTLRFPDEKNDYRLAVRGFLDNSREEIKSPLKSEKSRCFPQDDITGCDPYCVCDTVVEKKCQDGSSISGKCSDSGSRTDNSASYTFNEACETSTQTEPSSNPSTSRSSTSQSFSSSSTESSTTVLVASQSIETIIVIIAGVVIAFVALVALTFQRKTKHGSNNSSDESSAKKQFIKD